MNKIAVVYWSSTGNTETMANAIADSAKAAGADVTLSEVTAVTADETAAYDVIALGCPAMGDEVLEEGDFEPFFADLEGKLSGKKVALFGSYDWGDGQWMRDWFDRTRNAGADLCQEEGLIANIEPDEEALDACRALGEKLASA